MQELSAALSMTESRIQGLHPMTSVVAAEVAPDLKTCKAYISVLGDEKAQKDTLEPDLKQRGRVYPA